MARYQADMKIIGQQTEQCFLIEVAPVAGNPMGRVLDLKQKLLFPPTLVDSILNRGYWEEYTGSQDRLPELLRQVEEAP